MKRAASKAWKFVNSNKTQRKTIAHSEKTVREQSVSQFIRAQELIQKGEARRALTILRGSLANDPTHIDSIEIAIDLIHRHGEQTQIADIITDIVSMNRISPVRQRDIIDLVVPYGSEESIRALYCLLTESEAQRIYEKVNYFIEDIKDHDCTFTADTPGEAQEWMRAALATENWAVALNIFSDASSAEVPTDSLRRAIRRLNNSASNSEEFERLISVFLVQKPEDRWAQGVLNSIHLRKNKRREKSWRDSFDAAGFPFYRQRNGVVVNQHTNRVLYVLHNSVPFDSGGYALRTEGIVHALRKSGWEPICVTRPGYGAECEDGKIDESQDYLRLSGVEGLTPQVSLFGYVEDYAQKLFDIARSVCPEIVHAASNHWTGIAGAQVAQALKLPFVYEVRGLWELTQASLNRDYSGSPEFNQARRLEVAVAQRADAVVTLTEQLKDLLVSEGVKKHKIFVVPNGVDISRFQSVKDSRRQVPIFGYIGSVVKYEGLDLLLRASEMLHRRGVQHKVHIIGDGGEREALEDLAETLGISRDVKFFGRVSPSEAARLYRAVSVAVYPRLDVPVCRIVSPLKPFEALASGTPVLASDVAPLADIIDDGITGVLHVAGSVGSITDKMALLATDEQERDRLGRNGALRAATQFQWDQRVDLLVEAYQYAVLKNNGRVHGR